MNSAIFPFNKIIHFEPAKVPEYGALRSALLWEGRLHLNRLELFWPKGEPAPPPQDVEVRVYGSVRPGFWAAYSAMSFRIKYIEIAPGSG